MQHVGGMMELLKMDADEGTLSWICCLYWIFVIFRIFQAILIIDYQLVMRCL